MKMLCTGLVIIWNEFVVYVLVEKYKEYKTKLNGNVKLKIIDEGFPVKVAY